ncbi:MAG: Jag N-terminal domain-containing protein [Myxococcales bacterium]|nr:Jag N-terminal domain-containing protein [Myxococcales bacterium]
MSLEREFEGSSEEEALRLAAEALGISVSEVDYTLLDEGAKAVFGLGARPARIRVAFPTSAQAVETAPVATGGAEEKDEEERPSAKSEPAIEKAAKAEEIARELLKRMQLEGTVVVRDEEEVIVVEISDAEGSTEVEELFTNARPPLAPSFQFLLNKMVNRFPVDRKHILLKTPGRSSPRFPRQTGAGSWGEEFDPELVAVAKLLWERALKTKRIISVHPMHSGDRRTIHQTIMGLENVRTVSIGEGIYRRMYVVASGAEGGGGSTSHQGANGRRRRRRNAVARRS